MPKKKKEEKAPNELMLTLAIEKSKLNREKSLILLDKGMLLYFSFLFIAVLGFVNEYIDVNLLNGLVLMSFGVLIVAITPYIVVMHKEEQKLSELFNSFRGGGKRAKKK
mgnify:CR=1 FL=1